MGRFLSFLLNPYFLTFIPAVIIFCLLNLNLKPYFLDIDKHSLFYENEFIFYEDLNGNGFSERIQITDKNEQTKIEICKHNGLVYDQWNLYGNIQFYSKSCLYISGDYNSDGIKELYIFTLSNDSVFLHSIESPNEPDLMINKRFIVKAGKGFVKPDPFILTAKMQDLDDNGQKELIFGISSGFSLYPRNVFAYYIQKDSLVMSPESYYHITKILQADLTGNGKNEIIPYGHSTANISPEEAKFHDFSNWLMVLDQDLHFLFEPVEIPGKANYYYPYVLSNNGKPELIGIPCNHRGGGKSEISFFDAEGKLKRQYYFDYFINSVFFIKNKQDETLFVISDKKQGFYIYDQKLKKKLFIPGIKISYIKSTDLTNDGNNEIVIFDLTGQKLYVFNNDFSSRTSVDIAWPGSGKGFFTSVKKNKDNLPEISMQIGSDHYLISYKENPNLYLNYLLFLPTYIGLLGFAFIIRNLQKQQINKKRKVERKITELQLNLLKNQIDPHFSMNAINSVIHSLKENEIEKASTNLLRYASLYRTLLLTSDNIQRSLEDELRFCKDYLELEKARLNNSFEVTVNVNTAVDIKMKIPKMAMQVYVENAVKHGLAPKKGNGQLDIEILKQKHHLEIRITDNGVGREYSNNKGNSTGKGISIMKQYFEFYNDYYNQNFKTDIVDLYNDVGKPAGTRVVIHNYIKD